MRPIHLTDAATAFEPTDPEDRVSSVTPERLIELGLDSKAVQLFFGNRFVAGRADVDDGSTALA